VLFLDARNPEREETAPEVGQTFEHACVPFFNLPPRRA
jgi:hypothetical protein